ncbi:MAG TPA: L-dopachrome tautomerase-related protein [Oligoflexus sp.]|uniref:SMP-30/gluconolactonase/LRE family protein n=1 Tax=Oligoflexus sp. TaxID=1971216 RepID=UPI002D359DB8|nr:L-dopachrome tautomerase-related protein [Oligoflexus sp.]HYX36203.1 L-dopachrome tautomerase-related protein [Oligoflexus sp.]
MTGKFWSARRTLLAFVSLAAILFACVIGLKIRYGRGDTFADVSTPPLLQQSALETLVELNFPPGNIAVSPDGRIFFNYHPFAQAHRFTNASVFELVDGSIHPYPDAAFQAKFQGVFGMTVDNQRRLWVTEPASLDHDQTKVLAFDIATGALVFEYAFPVGQARFAQDLRVSPDGSTVVFADTGFFRFTPASLVILDVDSKKFRTVLLGHASTQPQNWIIKTPFGKHSLAFGLITFSVGVDGLAFSRDGSSLYFASMNHDTLYEIPYNDLVNEDLSEDEAGKRIRAVGRKPQSDGIAVNAHGDIFITDVENGGIARLARSGKLETLVKDSRIIWADGIAVTPAGQVLFTDSAIPAYIDQFARPPTRSLLQAGAPYRIYRFQGDLISK